MRRLRLAVALIAPVLLAACADASGPPAPTIEETTFAASLGIDLQAMTKKPSGLYYRDVSVGQGAEAAAGKSVTVHYRLWLPNGTLLDANVEGSDAPLPFVVGSGGVIAGFSEGVAGMRVGGRRQVIVPPALGYGSQPYGPIPGNSILVFQIDLVSVT